MLIMVTTQIEKRSQESIGEYRRLIAGLLFDYLVPAILPKLPTSTSTADTDDTNDAEH